MWSKKPESSALKKYVLSCVSNLKQQVFIYLVSVLIVRKKLMFCTWYYNSIPVLLKKKNFLNFWKKRSIYKAGRNFKFQLFTSLKLHKKASNNDSTIREIFRGPGKTWTYDRTIMSPYTVFYTGFHQVRLTNINSTLTLLFTNTKCYWIVLKIMADRHLYGHKNTIN